MATATSKATIKIDKISSSGGPDVKSSGSIALKKKVNDVTLTVAFTDATLQDYNNLTDIVVTAEKSLGSGLKSNVEYNAGKRATKVTTTWVNDAKDVTLKGIWTEKDNAWKGEATIALDSSNKVGATYDFAVRKSTASWTHTRGNDSLTGKYDFSKSNWLLTATTKASKDSYKAELDVGSKGLTLEYARKPFKVVGKGVVSSNGVRDLSVAATAEYVYEF